MDLCYLVTIAAALFCLVWGLMLMLGKAPSGTDAKNQLVSQMRGLGYVIASQVILLIGLPLCYDIFGKK